MLPKSIAAGVPPRGIAIGLCGKIFGYL